MAIIGANRDIFGYNLYAYVSNNPIMNSDLTGYGLFDNIIAFMMDVKTKINTVRRKIQVFADNIVGNILSVDYNISLEKSYETGSSMSKSSTISGNKNSLIKVSLNNNNNNFWNSTFGISMNTSFANSKVEIGPTSFGLSGGFSIDNTTYNINAGINKFNLYAGARSDININRNLSNSYYGRFNVNMFIPIAAYGVSSGMCSSIEYCIPQFVY